MLIRKRIQRFRERRPINPRIFPPRCARVRQVELDRRRKQLPLSDQRSALIKCNSNQPASERRLEPKPLERLLRGQERFLSNIGCPILSYAPGAESIDDLVVLAHNRAHLQRSRLYLGSYRSLYWLAHKVGVANFLIRSNRFHVVSVPRPDSTWRMMRVVNQYSYRDDGTGKRLAFTRWGLRRSFYPNGADHGRRGLPRHVHRQKCQSRRGRLSVGDGQRRTGRARRGDRILFVPISVLRSHLAHWRMHPSHRRHRDFCEPN